MKSILVLLSCAVSTASFGVVCHSREWQQAASSYLSWCYLAVRLDAIVGLEASGYPKSSKFFLEGGEVELAKIVGE